MKSIILCIILLMLFSSCRKKITEKQPIEKDESRTFSEQNKKVLQSFCNHLCDSADAGIAVADLRARNLLVISHEQYISASSYKPASTFKILTAINSILENISVPKNFRCTGKVIIDGKTINCWYKRGHGSQSLSDAITNSCNCYFAILGSLTSSANLRSVAEHVGYGRTTFFRLNGESNGVLRLQIPDEEKTLFALGHSACCEVTGLQLLQLMCILATKGECIHQTKMYDWEKLSPVFRGMEGVVLHGTGKSALVSSFPAAGKTGTSETTVSWDTRAWFCGFAPYDDPEYALVVFSNHGTGSTSASPLAGLVFGKIAELRNLK